VTSVDAQGESGPVKLIFSITKRRNLGKIIDIIKKYNPNAFYTIEDMRYVNQTYPYPLPLTKRSLFPHIAMRKRK
jgi:hypothetical protein